MKIDARLTFEKVRFDQDFDAHLVISLMAPSPEGELKRPRICIIPVIDVSPSMAGEKIAYAKRSVEKLIDHLSPTDYCGLVQFSGRAEVIQRPVKVTTAAKDDLKRKVGDLQLGSATNIADALLVGCELANQMDLPGEIITRVIIFTDGQANTGPAIHRGDILKLVEANVGIATVSAFGYGRDADQTLLSEMAKLGKANYAFIQNPDDALTAFGKELGGLLSTYATSVELNVSPLVGHEISSIVSDVDAEEEKIGGDMTIKIPELLAEEQRDIVLAVKLKAQQAGGPRPVNVFEVKAGYDILDANRHKERKAAEAKAKAQFVRDGEQDTKANPDLDRIVGLAQVIRAQIEAEEQAKRGNFLGAQQVMAAAAASVQQRGHGGLQRLASNVSSRLASPSHYADGASYLASSRSGGTRGYGVTSYDANALSDLESVGVQVSNSVQTSTSNAFAGGAAPVVPAPVGDLGAIIGAADLTGGIQLGGGVTGLGGALSPSWASSNGVIAPPVAQQGIVVAPLPQANSESPKKDSKKPALKKQKSSRNW